MEKILFVFEILQDHLRPFYSGLARIKRLKQQIPYEKLYFQRYMILRQAVYTVGIPP